MVRMPKLDLQSSTSRGQPSDGRSLDSSRLFGLPLTVRKATVGLGSAAISCTQQTVSAAATIPLKAAVVAAHGVISNRLSPLPARAVSAMLETGKGMAHGVMGYKQQVSHGVMGCTKQVSDGVMDCTQQVTHGVMGCTQQVSAHGVMDAAVALPARAVSAMLETGKGAAHGVIECTQQVTHGVMGCTQQVTHGVMDASNQVASGVVDASYSLVECSAGLTKQVYGAAASGGSGIHLQELGTGLAKGVGSRIRCSGKLARQAQGKAYEAAAQKRRSASEWVGGRAGQVTVASGCGWQTGLTWRRR